MTCLGIGSCGINITFEFDVLELELARVKLELNCNCINVLSDRYSEKRSTANCASGNEESNFVSEIHNTST